jgi:hypothetical protein
VVPEFITNRQKVLVGDPMKNQKAICCLGLVAGSLMSCSTDRKPAEEAAAQRSASAAPGPDRAAGGAPASATVARRNSQGVRTEMRNVMFRLNGQAAHLEFLTGEIWPTGNNEMPVFDDKASFEMRVTNGKVSIALEDVQSILNEYVFARADAPLKDLSLSIDKDRLRIKGKLHSKGDIPFETAGTLSADPDGRVRVNTEKVKALHVPVKGVMGLFGIELANLINTSKIEGIDTDKNDLIVDLETLLPPPHLKGKISTVGIEGNGVVMYFGDREKSNLAPMKKANYILLQGDAVRFGKFTMENTDLTLLDLDPADPLDLYQDHYREQLAAGYSKITADFGLRAYVKDYAKLGRGTQVTRKGIKETQ